MEQRKIIKYRVPYKLFGIKTKTMEIHNLKTIQPYFDEVKAGRKTFEVRLNDRDFQVGDTLILCEYKPENKEYTGQEVEFDISYILSDFNGLHKDFVVLGLQDRRIGCKCRQNQKHGTTSIDCCNRCGKPTEEFWTNKNYTSVKFGSKK